VWLAPAFGVKFRERERDHSTHTHTHRGAHPLVAHRGEEL